MLRETQPLQLYTFADLVRLLKVNRGRLRAMRDAGQIPGPDIIIPGAGHKGARWSAARVSQLQAAWRIG